MAPGTRGGKSGRPARRLPRPAIWPEQKKWRESERSSSPMPMDGVVPMRANAGARAWEKRNRRTRAWYACA
eukprot:5037001-Pleurochrysis_carterae.AAC.1